MVEHIELLSRALRRFSELPCKDLALEFQFSEDNRTRCYRHNPKHVDIRLDILGPNRV